MIRSGTVFTAEPLDSRPESIPITNHQPSVETGEREEPELTVATPSGWDRPRPSGCLSQALRDKGMYQTFRNASPKENGLKGDEKQWPGGRMHLK